MGIIGNVLDLFSGKMAQDFNQEGWGAPPQEPARPSWAEQQYADYKASIAKVVAKRDPAAKQAIDIRSKNIRRSPLQVYQVTNPDSENEEEELSYMMTALLRQIDFGQLEDDLMTYGEAWLRRTLLSEFERIVPGRVDKQTNANQTEITGLEVDKVGVPLDEMIHIYYENAINPVATFNCADLELALAESAKIANIASMRNGITSDFILLLEQMIPDVDKQRLVADLNARYAGVTNRRTPMVIDGTGGGATAVQVNAFNSDMEFGNTILLGVRGASQASGVPPMLLADLSDSTYSNFREAVKLFREFTIYPELQFFQDMVEQKILSLFTESSYRARFDLSVFEDEQDRRDRLRTDYAMGLITLEYTQQQMGYPVEEIEPPANRQEDDEDEQEPEDEQDNRANLRNGTGGVSGWGWLRETAAHYAWD